MSQTVRQTNLLFAEDWRKIYQEISQVNFQAGDFDTYRASIIDYLRIQYPESYNDWIENDEFVFIMDTFCWLATSYNFRVEQAVRDNLIDHAERRESILALAKLLNYSPSRNLPARGLVKLVQIETDEPIQDIDGSSLQNVPVDFNDSTNPDWADQFIQILNSSFISTNPFGNPVKEKTVTGVQTQLYQMDSKKFDSVAYPFSATINGTPTSFEIVNPDIDLYIFEREPDPSDSFHLIYRNDGSGNGSQNTGFFLMFKQGTLSYVDDLISVPEENKEISISDISVNDTDVWVHEIDSSGNVLQKWTKVPSTENIAYNSIGKTIRTIFEVKTGDQDTIGIRYADGRFGDTPVGLYRTWYRTSNGLSYQIRAQDIRDVQITVPYVKGSDTYYLKATFSLQSSVSNSSPAESTEQIRERAPQIQYTQNRMVTGEDYNIFPLRQGSTALKIKTVNRTYAGHSRFIDRNDPTGTYQNVKMVSDDGMVYRNPYLGSSSENLPSSLSNTEIVRSRIVPLLDSNDLVNMFYASFSRPTWTSAGNRVLWVPSSNSSFSSTGKFYEDTTGDGVPDGSALAVPSDLSTGATVRVVDTASGAYTISKFVTIETVQGTGQTDLVSGAGPIEINESLTGDWYVESYYPAFKRTLTDAIVSGCATQMDLGSSFGLKYQKSTGTWAVVTEGNLNAEDIDGDSDFSSFDENDGSKNWLILAYYNTGSSWDFYVRYMGYFFESLNDVRFFLGSTQQVDLESGQSVRDQVRILKVNENLSDSTNTADPLDPILGTDLVWTLTDPVRYSDGYIEPRRVKMTMLDSDADGAPDDPMLFEELISEPAAPTPTAHRFLFFQKSTSVDGYEYFNAFDTVTVVQTIASVTGSGYEYVIDADDLYLDNVIAQENCLTASEEDDYYVRIGRSGLMFKWQHYANTDTRIDPSPTNIHDVFVLTSAYYSEVQSWLNSLTRSRSSFPVPPTIEELNQTFSSLNYAKMLSDTVVYRPAKFKLLFGPESDEELQATFKVVKVPGSTMTDNEIKLRVLEQIQAFFDVQYWDFGEMFSASELSAVIHQSLPGIVGHVVIVPNKITQKFGNLYQIRSESDELFLSCATVQNIQVVQNLTSENIRIGS